MIYYVNDGDNLQAVIDKADPGDSIVLGEGTYDVIRVKRGVSIIGATPDHIVRLDKRDVLTISDPKKRTTSRGETK